MINYTFLFFISLAFCLTPAPHSPLPFLTVAFLMMYDNSYISLFLLLGEGVREGHGESFVFPL